MNACLRSLLVAAVLLPLTGCKKPTPSATSDSPTSAAKKTETETQLVEARDALQRQALEIETKTALMDKQLAEMEQALKDRENDQLRDSLEALKQQNQALREQADRVRDQSEAMTQRIAATVPSANLAPPVLARRDHSLFYEKLAPHGRWMDVSGYGYCWRPTIARAGWRPYGDGCWVWSSMGWTWQSNEPFGWATYHYGRWVNLARHGWIWVPGSEWAPAWVSWRQSRDHIGWAPLPPDRGSVSPVYRDCDTRYNLGPSSYVFIHSTHFVRSTYTTVYAPVTQCVTIFQSSVNVTQIVRCDDRATTCRYKQHGGPSLKQVEKVCARPVPQIQLQPVAASQFLSAPTGQRPLGTLATPVLVELPVAKTGVPVRLPPLAEQVAEPRPVDAFEGLPQRVAVEIREMITAEGQTAAVQRPASITRPLTPIVARPSPETPSTAVNSDAPQGVRPVAPPESKSMIQPVPAVTVSEPPITPASPAAPSPSVGMNRPIAPAPAPSVVTPAQQSVPAPVAAVDAPAPTLQPTPVDPTERPATQRPDVQTMPATPAVVEAPVSQQNERPARQRGVTDAMALEKNAAAEAEKALRQVNAEAERQRQQEELAAQQRAAVEQAAAQQAMAAAEAERAQLQANEVAMQQRQQQEMAQHQAEEQAQRAAEEQRQQPPEVEQRQAEEQAQRAAEEQRRQQQEMAQRQAEEQAQRAAEEQRRQQQEMAQRQAEEQARRADEEQMRQQQEMAQRRAEEQARRAQEEQMRQQQEMAQRQAEEQARRAAEEQMRQQQEMAQHQAGEQARRAAAEEAARRQP